ncbi:hypothetical protein E2C01_085320 [Portunus trituberculatus]|nr:hypothetical protein [Portunus trituberculatus]
MVARTRA